MKLSALISKILPQKKFTLLALFVFFSFGVVIGLIPPSESAAFESLDPSLKPYLAQYNLPALAAAVVREGQIVAAGAVGTRRAGTEIPVTLNDRFHIGSDTKAMTALLAAMMVEEGKLRWNSTMAEVFPEMAAEMNADLKKVTLEQLLYHSSGIPSDNERLGSLYEKSFMREGNLDEIRRWLVREMSRDPLQSKPGTQFNYSNTGYITAGAMVERVTGKTWEELIRQRIFTPLELTTAGLGVQATMGMVDAPLPHVIIEGKLKGLLAGPAADIPVVMGPAGDVHMSVLDFARWAGWNAGEGKRGPKLVSAEILKKLHRPVIEAKIDNARREHQAGAGMP